jgi:hypothetical protein
MITLQHILSNRALGTKRLCDLGAGEADQVVVLGFPLGIVDPPAGRPIVRSGVIARIQDVYDSFGTTIMIDVQVFPGNSGAPVFLLPQLYTTTDQPPIVEEGLIGVVHALHTSPQTRPDPSTGTAVIVTRENAGLGYVQTVAVLHQTIEHFERVHPLPRDSSAGSGSPG